MALGGSTTQTPHFIVQESLDLGTLEEVLHFTGAAISVHQRFSVLLQVGKALYYLHERGLVHNYVTSSTVQVREPSIVPKLSPYRLTLLGMQSSC